MKRAMLAAILAIASAALFADETAEIYQMLYSQADGLQQKRSALVNLVALGDKSTAPVLAGALRDMLLAGQSYSAAGDQELYGDVIRILAQALGDYKYSPAAPFLWDASENVPAPLARAEAIIAIGKLRDLGYAERISLRLRDLNLKPTADRDEGEKLAYACVVALYKLKDPVGFSPVFFAVDAWYSQRVRQQAAQALPGIAADPTDPIKEIVASEEPPRKLRALQAEMASKAAPGRKAEVAVLALNLGHLMQGRDRADAKLLADIRKLSLRGLVSSGASGPDPVDGCASSYAKGFDDEERLLALQALGANPSDPAATALRDIILKLNEDQKAGLGDETRLRMAKAAVENAGASKNRILRPALLAVTMNDRWSGGVLASAQAALKGMQ
jgi:HEAT repeat protein